MRQVITFGTFDMFHIGHLNILERASALGDNLIVGVSSDNLNYKKKSRHTICPQSDRMGIVAALKCVSHVFLEESLELKAQYIKDYRADILIMGDDWVGRFDHLKKFCEVVYLERTPSISTTELIEVVKSSGGDNG